MLGGIANDSLGGHKFLQRRAVVKYTAGLRELQEVRNNHVGVDDKPNLKDIADCKTQGLPQCSECSEIPEIVARDRRDSRLWRSFHGGPYGVVDQSAPYHSRPGPLANINGACKLTQMLTLDTLCAEMVASGRHITRRGARDWWSKGLLPQPSRRGLGRGLGTETFWTDSRVLCQAQAAYDLLSQYARSDFALLSLWLLGFPVPLATVRRIYGSLITLALQAVRGQAGQQPEDILGEIASKTARVQTNRRAMPIDARQALSDLVLEVLEIVYGFEDESEPDALADLWGKVAPYLNANARRGHEFADGNGPRDAIVMVLKFIKDAASLPAQQRAMYSAEDTEIVRARRLVLVASGHLRRMVTINQENLEPWFYHLTIALGGRAVPILVATLANKVIRQKIMQSLLEVARAARRSNYEPT